MDGSAVNQLKFEIVSNIEKVQNGAELLKVLNNKKMSDSAKITNVLAILRRNI